MHLSATPRRLALLDRDGTIVVDKVSLRDPVESTLPQARLNGRDCADAGSQWFDHQSVGNRARLFRPCDARADSYPAAVHAGDCEAASPVYAAGRSGLGEKTGTVRFGGAGTSKAYARTEARQG
jgi:hypothetical protein